MENKRPNMMRPGRRLLIALVSVALACAFSGRTALAQQGTAGGANPEKGYKIGAGDLIRIEVVGRPDLTGNQTVGTDGTINLPGVGPVKAADRTTAELALDLSRRISLSQREIPQVIVTLVESRSRKVFVLGSVLIPGSYPLAEDASIWDAIAEAGGPTEDANLSAVEVIPGSAGAGETGVTVDIAAAIREGRLDKIQHLKPGDTVRVPRSGGVAGVGDMIYIFGAVGQQGPRPVEPGGLVPTIIKAVPGPDAKYSEVEIVRTVGAKAMRMRVNVEEYLTTANAIGNPALQAGDTVYIPHEKKGFNPLVVLTVMGTILGLTASIIAISNNHH